MAIRRDLWSDLGFCCWLSVVVFVRFRSSRTPRGLLGLTADRRRHIATHIMGALSPFSVDGSGGILTSPIE
jgi:hypothetical protein